MKKVKFVSGFNAKVALAACAVAGFSLTGCDEEDFTVDVPNITVTTPEIEWPETADGIAYLLLSATSSTGENLADVTFSIDGEVQSAVSVAVSANATYTITAEKTGYYSNSLSVSVPNLPDDAVLSIPVNLVLTPIDVDETNNVSIGNIDYSESEDLTESFTPTEIELTGTYEAGVVPVNNVEVPTAAPFLTAAQETAFYAAVDEYLEGYGTENLSTRALSGDLLTVKDLFYAQILALTNNGTYAAKTVERDYSFTLSAAATNIVVTVNTTYLGVNLTINVVYKSIAYSVSSQCTVASSTTVSATADGVDLGHGHSHGDSTNSGGGVWE